MSDKKRVLFVDDEPRVLEGIRRMLHSLRDEWDMSFATSGQEALDMIAEKPVQMIVSDMRMPGMDGSRLLTEVMKSHPQTARIALSGQTKKEDILRAVGPVHQFLSKPCDAETLRSTLVRAVTLRDLLAHDRFRELLSQVESLPSMPSLYQELMEKLESPDASVKEVERIVSQDIGMSAKVLQLVNSAFFGVRQHISSPAQAVALLGLDTVRALVVSVNVFCQFDEVKLKGLSLEELWRHSMTAGGFAKRIAKAEGVDLKTTDHAFIAGLLHDAGKLVLAARLPKEYAAALANARENRTTLHEAEREILGATHAELGAYLLGLWGFCDGIVEALAFHHNPIDSPVMQFSILTAVHVADALANKAGPDSAMGTSEADDAYLTELGLTERLTKWRATCSEVIQEEDGE